MEFEILIIDDKVSDAESAAEILTELPNVKTSILDEPEKALMYFERNPDRFSLVLIDFNLNLKDMDGLVLAKKIWKINPSQLIGILSGENSLDAPIKCVGTPIVEFIKKSAPATQIQKKVQSLLFKYAATHPKQDLTKELQENQKVCQSIGLIGRSTVLANFAKSMIKVSASDASTVLIRGESGTGKELIAQGIHKLSRRKSGPFIPINMGAFQSTLIESELFGHEKGAFTGAQTARKGAFELANGGTIFLDEIGELPMDLQVKLLRVLQEREVQPVGSTKPVKIDIRIIAATHVDLESQIAAGRFRFDLFQRLNVISLNVPKLSDRSDDIEILVKHFLSKFHSTKTLHPTTLFQLEKYKWPGNVRELENLIQKLDILTDDQVILPQHLPSDFFVSEKEKQPFSNFDFTMNYKEMGKCLRTLEKNYFVYHLTKAKSIRDAALNRMEIAPSTLRDKMDLFDIKYKVTETQHEGVLNDQSV